MTTPIQPKQVPQIGLRNSKPIRPKTNENVKIDQVKLRKKRPNMLNKNKNKNVVASFETPRQLNYHRSVSSFSRTPTTTTTTMPVLPVVSKKTAAVKQNKKHSQRILSTPK